jgi:alkylhydroperoxidase family enzyme
MARAALGEALVQAVFDDWRTAPVSEGLRLVCGMIEALTRDATAPTAAQVAAMHAAGVSTLQIEEAIHICGAFNMIVRIADALGFETPDVSSASGYGQAALQRGYL